MNSTTDCNKWLISARIAELIRFQRNPVFRNIEIATIVLFTPFLALLCPLFLFIGKAASFTNVETLPVCLRFLDH